MNKVIKPVEPKTGKGGKTITKGRSLSPNPTQKQLTLNSDIARTVVYKALTLVGPEWSAVEQFEVDRLISRLVARGV